MKIYRIITRNLRDSFKSIFRNFSLSLASISCITITLLVVMLSIVLSFNVNNFTDIIKGDVSIVAYIDNDAKDSVLEEIEPSIEEIDNVESISYKGKKEITKEMTKDSDTLDSVIRSQEWSDEENPIQNTYLVKVTNIEDISKTAAQIDQVKGITSVKYGEGMVENLMSSFKFINEASIAVVITLIIVTAFLISNTIKITIFSRQREIVIMRLVGASNLNIKIPFIMEGLFIGILGSIIPIIVTVYGYNAVYSHFGGKLFSDFIRLINPEPFVYFVSLVLLVIGILVGMFGSYRAVQKYLKV